MNINIYLGNFKNYVFEKKKKGKETKNKTVMKHDNVTVTTVT